LYPAIIPKAERPPKTKIARNICGRIVPSFMIGSFLHAPESRVYDFVFAASLSLNGCSRLRVVGRPRCPLRWDACKVGEEPQGIGGWVMATGIRGPLGDGLEQLPAAHVHHFVFPRPVPFGGPIIVGACACGEISEGLAHYETVGGYDPRSPWRRQRRHDGSRGSSISI
jgi:hypothetical protein